jgi:uncharacterized protein YybS (DUF2232 family)
VNRVTPSIRQPLFWCAVLIIVLLSLLTPAILLTISLIMVPMLMLYLKLDLKRFILAYVSTLFVLFVLLGGSGLGVLLSLFSLFFIPAVITMGQLYKKGISAKAVIVAGILSLITEILLLLFMSYSAGMNPIGNFKLMFMNNLALMPENVRVLITPEYVEQAVLILPFLILFLTSFYIMLTHAITRRLLKKSSTPLSGLPPIREWRLPKSMVWYFLTVFVLGLFIDGKSDLYFQMIVYNFLPLFMVLFLAQTMGLLYDFFHPRKWRHIIPFFVVLLSFVPILLYLMLLVAILDIMLPLRQRFITK